MTPRIVEPVSHAAGIAVLLLSIAGPHCAAAEPPQATAAFGDVPLPARLEQLDEAVVALVRRTVAVVESNPKSPENWLQLAMVYHSNLQYDLARTVYAHVLDLDPTSTRAHYYTALCHHSLGDNADAIESMTHVTVQQPTYIPAWWHLALWQLDMGNLEDAERSARRAAHHPAGGVVLARVLLQKGAPEEAAERLERIISGFPDDRHAHTLLGTAYRQLGRTEEALRELNLGRGELQERPDPWAEEMQQFFSGFSAERKRADALLDHGRIDEAIIVLEALRAKRPEHVSVIAHLALACRRAERVDEAIALLREALKIQPAYDLAHFHLAGAYRQKYESPTGADPLLLEQAMAHADTVISLSPTFASGHGLRADILMNLGRNDDAVASLREAIRFESTNPLWPLRCGALLFEMGEFEAAIPLLRTAADLDPNAVQTLLALAGAYLRVGRLEEARPVLQTAARLAPENTAIPQTLQQIEQVLGSRERPSAAPAPEGG